MIAKCSNCNKTFMLRRIPDSKSGTNLCSSMCLDAWLAKMRRDILD